MLHTEALGLLVGAVALGAVHGIEPGHGWPVAATYALDRPNKWAYGFAASVIIGVGHLVSSIAMVVVFFYAKAYFNLTQVNQPIELVGGVAIGGPVSLVAGVLLIALGIREYTVGHAGGGEGDDHGDHFDGHAPGGRLARITDSQGLSDGHAHDDLEGAADRGLAGIAWFAFLLGFAHEEEFEIIALCAGSIFCLELMTAYAITVVVGIVGLTLVLIAGYEHFEEEVEAYTPYLPVFSAAVLTIMGLGFIGGVF